MAWKKLTFVLIPHSKDTVKQYSIPRVVLYGAAIFLVVGIAVMIFYILGFKGKSFYRAQTQDLIAKNSLLSDKLVGFDSTLVSLSTTVTGLESVNVQIMQDLDIPADDLGMTVGIPASGDQASMQPLQALAIIDRLERQSIAFDYNFSALYDSCVKNEDFFRRIPSIRPAEGSITRDFGLAVDKYSNSERKYTGIDIHNYEGTPIVATADGIIEVDGFTEELGRYITIDHENGYKTRYTHLQQLNQMTDRIRLTTGQKVTRGEQIATMGSTGVIFPVVSPHIMYTVYHHGIPVNPADYFFAPDFAAGTSADTSTPKT